VRFPFVLPESAVVHHIAAAAKAKGPGRFVIVNPGAGWPNKRWPPERFGAVAAAVLEEHALPTFVQWGHDEAALADAVTASSRGAAERMPATTLGDLLAVSSRAALMISGDTGPTHIAAAIGTPVVGLYGPTRPERNGPWHPDDVIVSRATECVCHHKRECQRGGYVDSGAMHRCINDISVEEVVQAVRLRLSRAGGPSR
jgi:ADP-heptose:LPS heptosyltransferase